MKLRWVEIDGMKYVGVDSEDYDCTRCVFDDDTPLQDYCGKIKTCIGINFIPLEPQHIPHLYKRGKTKWQN